MRFCSQCSAPLEKKIPAGDNLPRYVCDQCPTIHYENPKIVAGCIPEWNGQVLLCRRAIEPRSGYWTFPAGFMELGETVEQAACRETLEEAQALVERCELYAVVSMPRISQVYMVFRAQLSAPTFGPGSESLEVALFDRAAIPWHEMAFTVVTRILRRYDTDAGDGRFPLYVDDVS